MSEKKKNAALAVAAIITGTLAMPIGAFISWAVGLVFLSLPVYLIYKAS